MLIINGHFSSIRWEIKREVNFINKRKKKLIYLAILDEMAWDERRLTIETKEDEKNINFII